MGWGLVCWDSFCKWGPEACGVGEGNYDRLSFLHWGPNHREKNPQVGWQPWECSPHSHPTLLSCSLFRGPRIKRIINKDHHIQLEKQMEP